MTPDEFTVAVRRHRWVNSDVWGIREARTNRCVLAVLLGLSGWFAHPQDAAERLNIPYAAVLNIVYASGVRAGWRGWSPRVRHVRKLLLAACNLPPEEDA